MKGLLRDNFYAAYANAKALMGILLLAGIAVAIYPKEGIWLSYYMLCCLVGLNFVTLQDFHKGGFSRWEQYKLTLPVTRADIVRSCYAGHLFWMFAGGVFASVTAGLAVLLHGFVFDLWTDVLLIYIMGMSISLFMGAIFFPLLYARGEERKEASLMGSALFAVAIVLGLALLWNFLFGPRMTTAQIIGGGVIILFCAIAAYGVSYLLAVEVFHHKEY